MTERAEIVLPAEPFAETLLFFRERLGFRLESIRPADAPAVAVLSAPGLRIRLERAFAGEAGVLRIETDRDDDLTAPNGTHVQLRRPEQPAVPPATGGAVIAPRGRAEDWHTGRAGMLYRDLIPGRLGGHVVASHIRIPDGGPVPDDVHFHDIAFQMIYCANGWVRVVYEDQGGAIELRPGDALLQPPRIRHRVLECSDQLEVVELAVPAEHATTLDHDLDLPTNVLAPDRDFGGQRFHVYRVHEHGRQQSDPDDLGFGPPTQGLAEVRTVHGTRVNTPPNQDDRLLFAFVLRGSCEAQLAGESDELQRGAAVTVPAGTAFAFAKASPDCQLLRVRIAESIAMPAAATDPD